MSITYPLSAPPIVPASEHIALVNKFNFSESPYSGAQTATTTGYSQWLVTLDFANMTAAQAKTFMAWLDKLQGSYGTFTYQPYGSGNGLTGKTLSATANSTTNSISVAGWSAGQASGVAAGDYVTIGTQMFRVVTAPANADGSGLCALDIVPSVRTTIAQTTACNFATPTVTLRVSDGGTGSQAQLRTPDGITVPSISCVEAR